MSDLVEFLRARLAEDEAEAKTAQGFDYAQYGVWEARGPYPAACGEADGVSRPRGNLRAEIGTDDIFLEAELPWDLIPHMARHDPARTLRAVEAKRRTLELHRPDDPDRPECVTCGPRWPCRTVEALTSEYADHPDYRPEWAPTT